MVQVLFVLFGIFLLVVYGDVLLCDIGVLNLIFIMVVWFYELDYVVVVDVMFDF